MRMPGKDDFLYHYTSASGALGIFERQKIWATQIDHLNDGKDGLVVGDILADMARKPDAYFGSNASNVYPQRHRDALACHLGASQKTFAASFSRIPDALPQFRMYCPESGGFVIGFPRSLLEGAGELFAVIYDEAEQRIWCEEFFRMYLQCLADVDAPDVKDPYDLAYKADCKLDWRKTRIRMAPLFKRREFEYEQEERLVRFGPPTKFRSSRSGSVIIPYVEIDIPNDPLDVLFAAGPGPYQETFRHEAWWSIRRAAAAAGCKWQIQSLDLSPSAYRPIA